MGVVDILMVTRLGEEALAGIALGHTWSFGLLVLIMGATVGMDPLFGQAFGASKRSLAARRVWQGATLLALLCVPVMVGHLLASPVLHWTQQEVATIPIADSYCRILTMGVLPVAAFGLFRQYLQADGRMLAATWAIVGGNVINVILNYGLIFGRLGMPELGSDGTAWASLSSRFVMLAILCWFGRDEIRRIWVERLGAVEWSAITRLSKVSLPVAAQVGLEFWGFSLSIVMMGWLGSAAVSAHVIAINLASLAWMVPLGLSAAAATRIGNLVGARQPWQPAGWVAVAMGAGVMMVAGALFLLIPGPLVDAYGPEPHVRELALTLLPVAALFSLSDGVQVVTFGVLRGAGDTTMPALANIVGYYLLGLPLGWFLAFRMNFGPTGIWYGVAASLVIVSVILVGRLVLTGSRGGIRLA